MIDPRYNGLCLVPANEEETRQVEEGSIPADYDIDNDPDCILSPIFFYLHR